MQKFGAAGLVDELTEKFNDALPAMVYSPSRLMHDSTRALYELPVTLWDSVDEIIDEVVSTLLEGASTLIESVQDLLTARLKVPWLTRLIENMILGGRELNTLRLFSLAAAIPVVISEVPGGSTASTRESELVIQRSAGTTDGNAEQEQTREWPSATTRNGRRPARPWALPTGCCGRSARCSPAPKA